MFWLWARARGSRGASAGLGALGGFGGGVVSCSSITSRIVQLNGGMDCKMAARITSSRDKTKKRFQLMPTNQVA